MLSRRARSGISGFRSQSMIPYTSRTFFVNLMAVRSSLPPVFILQRPQSEGGCSMVELQKPRFDADAFLASAGLGRTIIQLAPKDVFFSQGDPADSMPQARRKIHLLLSPLPF